MNISETWEGNSRRLLY